MRFCALLLLLLLLIGGGVAGEMPPNSDEGASADRQHIGPEEISRLVMQLGSGSHRTRDKVTHQLLMVGPAAIPIVANGLGSSDREVYLRASHLLREFLRDPDTRTSTAAREFLYQLRHASDSLIATRAQVLLTQHTRFIVSRMRARGAQVAITVDGEPTAITFDGERMTDRDLALLRDLEQLNELDLRFNSISDKGVAYFTHLTMLKKLNLQGTNVTNEGLSQMQVLSELESLSVERTTVNDEGLRYLAGMDKLATLYLGGSNVTGPGLESLKHLPNLTYLSFQHSAISDEGVGSILQLPHIATLGLDNTKVTEKCLPQLVAYSPLRELWLTDAQITDESLVHLKSMKQLTAIHLTGTAITPRGLYDLSLALPGVVIDPEPPKERPGLPGKLPDLFEDAMNILGRVPRILD